MSINTWFKITWHTFVQVYNMSQCSTKRVLCTSKMVFVDRHSAVTHLLKYSWCTSMLIYQTQVNSHLVSEMDSCGKVMGVTFVAKCHTLLMPVYIIGLV